MVWFSLVWVWFGLVWVWFGLGLVWFGLGLVWIGDRHTLHIAGQTHKHARAH